MKAKDLFRYVHIARKERGWGRTLRATVAEWYQRRPAAELAAEMLECPACNGYTHRDLLRLSHPKPETLAHNALFQWAAEGSLGHLATADLVSGELRQVYAVERLKRVEEESEALSLIDGYALTPAMLPEGWRKSRAIWETLLERMDCAELVRNLTALAEAGVLREETAATALVVARLIDRRRVLNSGLDGEELARARDHYAQHPRALRTVIEALDAAMELAHSAASN